MWVFVPECVGAQTCASQKSTSLSSPTLLSPFRSDVTGPGALKLDWLAANLQDLPVFAPPRLWHLYGLGILKQEIATTKGFKMMRNNETFTFNITQLPSYSHKAFEALPFSSYLIIRSK